MGMIFNFGYTISIKKYLIFPNEVFSDVHRFLTIVKKFRKTDLRKQFDKAPEELFKDKEVCITGRIELYRDKPQIVIRSKEQIQIQ
jgi:hypothetical protein